MTEQKSGVLPNTKKCSKCKIEKPITEFHKVNTHELHSWCIDCSKPYYKQYRLENREKNSRYHKQYYLENREKLLQYDKEYRLENREKINTRQKEYNKKHSLTTNGKRYYGLNKRPRPQICELCGQIVKYLSYHHWDDNDMSMGVWVCYKCHCICEAIEHQQFTSISEKYREMKKIIEKEYEEKLA